MADFPLFGGIKRISHGLNLNDIVGTDITAGSPSHTKGAYVELLSAANNTEECSSIEIVHLARNQLYTIFLVDIAIGEDGFEVDVIKNIPMTTNANGSVWAANSEIEFPITIPAGVRISARCQSLSALAVVSVFINRQISGIKQPATLGKVITYGADELTSKGVEVTSGVDAYGAWTTITSSTDEEIYSIGVGATRDPVSLTTGNMVYQIGVGSEGNEEVIVDGLIVSSNTSEIIMGYLEGCYDVSVPYGSRISIRSAARISNVDFNFSYVIFGVN